MADIDAKPDLSGIDLSAVIGKLSQNPELLSMAAKLFSDIPKPEPHNADSSSPPQPSVSPDIIATLLPVLTGGNKKTDRKPDNHSTALLTALKPYLSNERREVIDRMLQFSKIGDIIGLTGLKKD